MIRKWSGADFADLSPAERLTLVEEIWDTLADTPESVPVTDAQREELDRRLDALSANPDSGSDWESVRARIEKGQ